MYFSPAMLILLVTGAVAFHVTLLVLAARYKLLWLLVVVLMFVAAFSLATTLPGVTAVKYIRIYLMLLTMVVALFAANWRAMRQGPSIAWLVFITAFVLTALYSDYPWLGLYYKGSFWAMSFIGLGLACSMWSLHDVNRFLRLLLLSFAVLLAVILVAWASHPTSSMSSGRLTALGMNPIGLASNAALTAPLCLYLFNFDSSRTVKNLSILLLIPVVAIILASGSRGGMLMALIGCFIVLYPMVKRPGRLLTVFLVLAVAWFALSSLRSTTAAERLTHVNLNSRLSSWQDGIQVFLQAPFFGHGWLHTRLANGRISTAQPQSMYLTILADGGLLLFLIFLLSMTYIGIACLKVFRITRASLAHRALFLLCLAYLAMIFAEGVAETGPVTGTNRMPILLGLSVGLIGLIPFFGAEQPSVDVASSPPVGGEMKYS